MVVYAANNMTHRAQARELLTLAAAEQYGLSPLPLIQSGSRGKPFFPDHPERPGRQPRGGGHPGRRPPPPRHCGALLLPC